MTAAVLAASLLLCPVSLAERTEDTPEKAPLSMAEMYGEALMNACLSEVREAYAAVLKAANRKDFKGYCAMYVNRLLVHFGINVEYIKGDANRLYGIYSHMEETDGGYKIKLYPARQYSLEEALGTILAENDQPRHIMAVFSKGVTEKGQEFGHVVYINCIANGQVVYSESSPYRVDNTTVVEQGEPLVCSVGEFAERYRYYKADGVVWFVKEGEIPLLAPEPAVENSLSASFRN